jgi:pyruvate/2-oxoglutarate dehydrogenase complex dihydrolipoamide acyltransferase (E2) component
VVIDMESLATGTLVEIVRDADEAIIQVGEIIGYLEDRSGAS